MRIATLESRICKPNGKPQIEHSNPVSSKRQLMQTQRNSTFRASLFPPLCLGTYKIAIITSAYPPPIPTPQTPTHAPWLAMTQSSTRDYKSNK